MTTSPIRRREPGRRPARPGLLLLVAGLTVWPALASAFHEGGVASCSGCHVMHGEVEGQIRLEGGEALLRAATATDVCLRCHGGQDGVFGLNPLDPPLERGAGNFVFLFEDNLNDAPDGQTHPIHGEAAGHNVVSLDYGTVADSRWTQAPGGVFPTSALGCTSCHDPHGNTSFRMLNGVGPVQGGLYEFVNPAPQAAGLPVGVPGAVESREYHTAYLAGMSEWCANCHEDYLEEHAGEFHPGGGHDQMHSDKDQDDGFEHATYDVLRGGAIRQYNRYDGDADPDGGIAALAYLPEVPFQSLEAAVTSTEGPSFGDEILCLSCHRAHASSAPAAGRWDFNVEFLAQDGLVSGSYPLPNPYDDPEQGSLCAKCHRGHNGPGGPGAP